MLAFGLAILALAAPAHAAPAEAAPAPAPPPAPTPAAPRPPTRLRAELGFAHWFGEGVGSPDGVTTPEVALAVEPGVAWMELQVRYTRSLPPLPGAAATAEGLGFAAFSVLLQHELRVGGEALGVYAGPGWVLTHDAAGTLGQAWTVDVGARWWFAAGAHAEVGPFVTAHQVSPIDGAARSAQVDLGVTVAFPR